MAISKSTPENIEDAAKQIFEDKILNELHGDSRKALSALMPDINWRNAYGIFVEYFPEIVAESDGMTLDMIVDALTVYDNSVFSDIDDWAEDNRNYYWWLKEENALLNFDDVVQLLSQYLYDYEVYDEREDCDSEAKHIARAIYG